MKNNFAHKVCMRLNVVNIQVLLEYECANQSISVLHIHHLSSTNGWLSDRLCAPNTSTGLNGCPLYYILLFHHNHTVIETCSIYYHTIRYSLQLFTLNLMGFVWNQNVTCWFQNCGQISYVADKEIKLILIGKRSPIWDVLFSLCNSGISANYFMFI